MFVAVDAVDVVDVVAAVSGGVVVAASPLVTGRVSLAFFFFFCVCSRLLHPLSFVLDVLLAVASVPVVLAVVVLVVAVEGPVKVSFAACCGDVVCDGAFCDASCGGAGPFPVLQPLLLLLLLLLQVTVHLPATSC